MTRAGDNFYSVSGRVFGHVTKTGACSNLWTLWVQNCGNEFGYKPPKHISVNDLGMVVYVDDANAVIVPGGQSGDIVLQLSEIGSDINSLAFSTNGHLLVASSMQDEKTILISVANDDHILRFDASRQPSI